ncbi:MAG: hypothetical protein ABEN55_08415, partial [Bradymonadaceae bacterium]
AAWDFKADKLEQLPTTLQLAGAERSVCREGTCTIETLDAKGFRVRLRFERNDGDWWGGIADYQNGQWADTRAVDIWETDEGPGYFEAPLVSPANGDIEAIRLRRGETGFYQYSVRRKSGGEATGYTQRTFLSAHHRHATFGPDGETLYYFTRDPVSGYIQLFQLRLDTVPTLN